VPFPLTTQHMMTRFACFCVSAESVM
jgi:hypothetical protein